VITRIITVIIIIVLTDLFINDLSQQPARTNEHIQQRTVETNRRFAAIFHQDTV